MFEIIVFVTGCGILCVPIILAALICRGRADG
jgi:hypothetical protein